MNRVLYGNMWVSPSFKMASYPKILEVCNGCGKEGITSITPDHFYGLRMTRCCNVHDWDYEFTTCSKHRANKWMLVNCARRVKHNTKWNWLKRLRLRRAKTYYAAVERWGH